MKQVRKISNIVAEELQEILSAQGVTVDESVFEERVSSIVGMLSDALNEGISSECGGKSTVEDDIDEELEVEEIFMATSDIQLGDMTVAAGEYIEINEIDHDEETFTVTVYDAEGEVKAEDLAVPYSYIEGLEANSQAVDFDETNEEVVEAVHIKGGKKVKVSAAVEKLRAKLKAKKGNGVNKFTIKNGKIVKKSAEQLKADKKRSKVFAKQMKKYAKKRSKSLKKAAKLNDGANTGSHKVVEGFDITSGEMVFAVEAGDVINYDNGTVSIVREGATIVKGLAVDEAFIEKCVSEGVVESVVAEEPAVETPATETPVEEEVHEAASVLSFQGGKGYVLTKEGSEVALGNRIRARAYLTNEGFNVTAEMLDSAADGELVTL